MSFAPPTIGAISTSCSGSDYKSMYSTWFKLNSKSTYSAFNVASIRRVEGFWTWSSPPARAISSTTSDITFSPFSSSMIESMNRFHFHHLLRDPSLRRLCNLADKEQPLLHTAVHVTLPLECMTHLPSAHYLENKREPAHLGVRFQRMHFKLHNMNIRCASNRGWYSSAISKGLYRFSISANDGLNVHAQSFRRHAIYDKQIFHNH